MQIEMSTVVALMSWQGFRLLQDFSSRDFTWLCIGALLAAGAMWGLAQRRRRWF
jgi:hypothetical protein